MPDSTFIFLDPDGRRWPLFRRLALWVGVAIGIAVVLFIAAVWIRPAVRLPAEVRELKGQLKPAHAMPSLDLKAESWKRYVTQSRAAQERLTTLYARRGESSKPDGAVRLGFYVDWDANSLASLHAHADQLTHVSPDWLTVEGVESALHAEPDPALSAFCHAHSLKIVPTLRNMSGDLWQPEAVESLARARTDQQRSWAEHLSAKLIELGANGVLLDFHELDPGVQAQFTTLFTTIADVMHPHHLKLWLAVSMDDEFATYDLAALAPVVDHFVAILFDEHSESDEPGPVASQDWLEGWLEVVATLGVPEKWVIALGTQGYDWNRTRGDAESLSFRDAMSRASYAGADNDGGLTLDPPSYNGHFAYEEQNGEHEVWFLDAASLHNEIQAAAAQGFSDFALFRLGTEDPASWTVLARGAARPDSSLMASLSKLPTDQTVTHVGHGEIVSVDLSRDDGTRVVTSSPDGKLSERYTDAPTYPALYHQGAADKTKVAITFDDGPDPVWTPRILDLLKSRDLTATFFLIGRNAEDYPGLVKRIVAEGHEIGNHTYSHGNLAQMPEWRQRLELDATERLLETITGRSTTLFRPPYDADSTPSDVSELKPLRFAEHELGYTVVLESIDPQDWARPGADAIVQRVKEQRRTGNVILLHDAGGDRSQTLAALPRILDWLAERGDRVVSLSELLNIPREELMPPVRPDEQTGWRTVAASGFRTWHWIVESLWSFMILATALVVMRSLVLAFLAWRQRRDSAHRNRQTLSTPSVSVLIAAYNEAKVVKRTLRSVLSTDYPGNLEVLVVDDGSIDDTYAAAMRVVEEDSRVRVLQQVNGGKSAALRRAVEAARHEVVIFLDADTLFERATIRKLVDELADPRVVAVSGNARVGNRVNFVTRCQALEYICGFNLDRRAYTRWNCVTVVPGAISAFRREVILRAGGFSHDTLAEDTDLTLTLHRLGYRISFAPEAIAWTEAPETWRALAKQRVRWAFGTMQCLWKHRDLTFNPRFGALGLFALPSIWFFHILLVAITPLADAILLWSLVAGYAATLGKYFAIFLLLDLTLATLACALERVPLRRALLILPMRFAYRWLLAWVVWKSMLRAVRGALVGWGKLERTGTAVPA
jgi:cellulose synthase/poly-beta-1,6-N-acetylglucosamine synthase-like glycosyltransferase/peptidoglycan/xylan/chitin deacetylase (PgdA/CDA1 family)/spore germination protein YaaH